jgi:hypothetical protein
MFTNVVPKDVQHDFVINSLLEKIECAAFHGKPGRPDVAMRSQHDDRQRNSPLEQRLPSIRTMFGRDVELRPYGLPRLTRLSLGE